MSEKQTLTNHQNLVIDGIKFFKGNLDKLRYDSMLTENAITTAEVSLYMILHQYTDEMGQILSLTKNEDTSERKQLCISNIAKEHDLIYETVKKAFESLIIRGYIAEVTSQKGTHYEIVNYAKYNQQTGNEDLNYIRIPHAIFDEKMFGTLIKHRYHKGPILILELCEYFTRQIGTNRRYVEDPNKITGIRRMGYLKKALNTTAKRVRQFLSIIHNIFIFTPVDQQVKKPSDSRFNRLRSFVQVCIDKFTFSLNPACFMKNENIHEKRTLAAAKKDMSARIKHANLSIKWRDRLDINKSISRMSKIANNLNIIGKSKEMIQSVVMDVSDTLEALNIKGEITEIKSIGAFVNKLFTNAWEDYQKHYMSESDKLEVVNAYLLRYGEPPGFLK